MNLNDIGAESLETSAAKGFGTISRSDWGGVEGYEFDPNKIPTKLCLIHSEVSEALEEFRKDHRLDKFMGELADIIIRTAQLGVGLGGDLDAAVAEKQAANRARGFKHGGRLI